MSALPPLPLENPPPVEEPDFKSYWFTFDELAQIDQLAHRKSINGRWHVMDDPANAGTTLMKDSIWITNGQGTITAGKGRTTDGLIKYFVGSKESDDFNQFKFDLSIQFFAHFRVYIMQNNSRITSL